MRSVENLSDAVIPNISTSNEQSVNSQITCSTAPLISKPFSDFTPEEFLTHCQAMKEIPERFKQGRGRKIPIARGLRVGKTKKGLVSITRAKAQRPFAYVLKTEIEELAKLNDMRIAEVWNAFKSKDFIIANSKMEAEKIYGELNNMPF